jgi:hypothetical protein
MYVIIKKYIRHKHPVTLVDPNLITLTMQILLFLNFLKWELGALMRLNACNFEYNGTAEI